MSAFISTDLVVSTVAAPKAHSVEFFERTEFPAGGIARRLAAALARGEGVGALATQAHLDAIRNAIPVELDVTGKIDAGQILLVDATEVFAALNAAPGALDQVLEAKLGAYVRGLTQRYGHATLYGELVDLFASAGDHTGALVLEQWWNRQLERLPIALHCGYSVESFDDHERMEAFRHICHHHGVVVPRGETGPHESERLLAELQQASIVLGIESAKREAFRSAYEGSRAAEQRMRDHLVVLQRITSSLCEAAGYRDIGEVVASEIAVAFQASRSVLVIEGELIVLRGSTTPDEPRALAAAIDRTPGAWMRIQDAPPHVAWLGGNFVALHPLVLSGQRAGTVVFGFDRDPGQQERVLAEDFVKQIALAVDRARSFEIAQTERERAESANRAKDQFIAMLGHELRNPLSPILTATQLMRLREPDILVKERSTIERSVTHMMRLVDDLLDVAGITRGKLTLVRTPVDLSEIVAQALEVASGAVDDRAHRVHVNIPSGLIVDADRTRLAQVISNLITNAAKYTKPGGAIEIVAGRKDNQIELVVIDNGIGIPADLLPHVFELFVQGAQGTDRAKGGLGLGLAISRKIVELHGGTIRAESAGPGHGSRMTISVPSWSTGRVTPAVVNESKRATTDSRRILVVDDNEDAAWLLAEALRLAGHEVAMSHDGVSALEVAREWQPQIAFLDVGLPGMDGYSLCQHLLELPLRPRIVAITGYGQAADRERAQAAGFDLHFVKPVSLRDIHAAIDAFIKQ